MPTNKEVLDVVEKWSGERPDKMSQSLEKWWDKTAPGSSHASLRFDPDGIADLVNRLKKAFPNSPRLKASDFKASGTVKTVQELVNALQPAVPSTAANALIPRAAAAPPKKRTTTTGKKKRGSGTRKPPRKGSQR